MLNTDQKELIEFIQKFAPELPIQQRIKIYRGFADFVEEKTLRDVFLQQATILVDAKLRCHQFDFKF